MNEELRKDWKVLLLSLLLAVLVWFLVKERTLESGPPQAPLLPAPAVLLIRPISPFPAH